MLGSGLPHMCSPSGQSIMAAIGPGPGPLSMQSKITAPSTTSPIQSELPAFDCPLPEYPLALCQIALALLAKGKAALKVYVKQLN